MLSSYSKSVLDGWPSAVAAFGSNEWPAEMDPMDAWLVVIGVSINGGTPSGWFTMENQSING